MKTSAIIVTYNKKNALKDSLDSIFNLSEDVYRVVVINNNSTDGTDKYLESITDDRLIYRNLKENIGGAGGFSKGLEIAYEETDADYFWIMDDDAIADKKALEALTNTAKKLNNKFGFLSSNVSYENGDGTNCPKTIDGSWNLDIKRYGLIRIKDGTFVSLFIKRDIVKKIGLPIGEMFIWGDDVEYTTRINNNTSYGSYFVMDSNITHMSTNVGTDIYNCPKKLLFRYKFAYRNSLYTDLHNHSKKMFIKTLLRDLYTSLKVLFLSKNHKLVRFCTVIKGIFNGLFFSPKIKFPKDKY